jgi:WD40 repeat protein
MHYWDLRNAKAPIYTNSDFDKVLMAVDFMPEGDQIIVSSIEGEIGIINVETPGSEHRQYYHDTMPAIRAEAQNNKALFDEQREPMSSIKHEEPVILSNIIYCVKTIPFDYGVFLYGAADANVTKCKIGNFYTELDDLFSGHSMGVRSIDYSRDHKSLITGCEDHSLRVWNYATGEAKYMLSGHHDVVSGGVFLNGDTIVSSSWDMTVKIWKI